MTQKILIGVLFFIFSNFSTAQDDIFANGFEIIIPVVLLNDTGINWGGDYPDGNNATCTSNITGPQDCNTGRDVTHNDPTDGYAGFSFTKLDSSGVALVDQGVSYEVTPWACVQDNVTGLVWEVKTTIAGIHHKDNSYQWGGITAIGRDHPNREGTYYDPSWNELVQGSNDDILCGFDNWRVPTVDELSGLAIRDSSNTNIDTSYFPNTEPSSVYWSSSPIANNNGKVWMVFAGANYSFDRDLFGHVRLVRDLGF